MIKIVLIILAILYIYIVLGIIIALLVITLCIPVLNVTGCTSQSRAKSMGGSMTLKLDPGQKLEEITWKDDNNLWYLTRPMRERMNLQRHIHFSSLQNLEYLKVQLQ